MVLSHKVKFGYSEYKKAQAIVLSDNNMTT